MTAQPSRRSRFPDPSSRGGARPDGPSVGGAPPDEPSCGGMLPDEPSCGGVPPDHPRAGDPLHRALADPGPPALRPLPPDVGELLVRLAAPPRLAAHLRAVHDVAADLLDWVARHHPDLPVDRDAVLFGAATHDIGKTLHPEELTGPGAPARARPSRGRCS